MPMYSYACNDCGHQHEALRKVGESAPECPTCKSAPDHQVKQVSSGTATCLMGYGWEKAGWSGPSKGR